jgi:hypothetical protein
MLSFMISLLTTTVPRVVFQPTSMLIVIAYNKICSKQYK